MIVSSGKLLICILSPFGDDQKLESPNGDANFRRLAVENFMIRTITRMHELSFCCLD